MSTDDFTKTMVNIDKKVVIMGSMIQKNTQKMIDLDVINKGFESKLLIQKEQFDHLMEDMIWAKKCKQFDGRISVLENEYRNYTTSNK